MFVKLGRDLAGAAAKPCFQLALFMVVAFVLRVTTFGHPSLHIDETFYFVVGEQMHKGAIPYVDIWDRKPFGLFLFYYLIVGIWDNLIAYQIAAWLFAGATAWVIGQIAARWGGLQGGLFAGILYLLYLTPLGGFGGQAPVFYNLLIASAALLMLRSAQRLGDGHVPPGVWLAMVLCALALTIKQSTLFEAILFGAYAALALLRSGIPKSKAFSLIARFMVIGAAPTVLIAVSYAVMGYWPEYWQAMVTSNIVRLRPSGHGIYLNMLYSISRIVPLICFALVSFVKSDSAYNSGQKQFAILWTFACAASLSFTPELYSLHLLPLLVPLCAATGLILGRRRIGWFAMGFATVFALSWGNPLMLGKTQKSRHAVDVMAKAITAHGGERGLFVYSGPLALYSLTGLRTMSPLVFTGHLIDPSDLNVSHLDTIHEVKRVLQEHPGVVVVFTFANANRHIEDSQEAVLEYVRTSCKLIEMEQYYYYRVPTLTNVYGDCLPPHTGSGVTDQTTTPLLIR